MNNQLKRISLFLLILVFLVAGFKLYRMLYESDSAGIRKAEPILAAYHYDSLRIPSGWDSLCHIGLRWNNSSGGGVPEALETIWPSQQPVMLTLEIWMPKFNKYLGNKQLLDQIIEGGFDRKINDLAAYLSKHSGSVWLRLNPEMEVYVSRYPWQMVSPTKYRESFRHIAQIIRKKAPSVKMVWAPAGYPGTEEYWPGKEHVDLITVTLKSQSESMTDKYPDDPSLATTITRKLHRVRFFDCPVLMLGSNRLEAGEYKRISFDSASNYIQQNKSLVYGVLNALDRPGNNLIQRKDSTLITGLYDPSSRIVRDIPVQAEHLFVNLHKLKSGFFRSSADSIKKRKHAMIVTMEPWKDDKLEKDPALIQNVLNGRYDTVMDNLYEVLKDFDQTIYLRWLHEMEIPITRYPWQSQHPVEYIKAYRYFVNYIRKKNPRNIFFVWGPAGDRGSMEFYPGDDVVDYVSIAIYGLPDKNITDHRKQETFATIYNRKYNRLWMSHKPIFITEFGIKGPPDYKQQWLREAAAVVASKKEIFGISYFNDTDSPKAWGDIEAPDWSITAEMYTDFFRRVGK